MMKDLLSLNPAYLCVDLCIYMMCMLRDKLIDLVLMIWLIKAHTCYSSPSFRGYHFCRKNDRPKYELLPQLLCIAPRSSNMS